MHGFCRPARTVSGDYYDFLAASSHKLILAVGDISGKGISAALLMATIHSAVRAYSVEKLPQMREPVAVGAVAGREESWRHGLREWRFLPRPCSACSITNCTKALRRKNMRRCFSESTTGDPTS